MHKCLGTLDYSSNILIADVTFTVLYSWSIVIHILCNNFVVATCHIRYYVVYEWTSASAIAGGIVPACTVLVHAVLELVMSGDR